MYKGIDVSYAQTSVDWEKVKAAGIQFVMIRCGYGKNPDQVDAMLASHVAGCEMVGLPYGFYHYGYADTPERARQEAAFCLSLIKRYTPTYPIVYDVEDASQASLDKKVLTDVAEAFLEDIAAAGYYPMLYASASWLTTKLDMSRLAKYDTWLAQWASAPTYKGAYGIWQSSEKGKVDGIKGNVDLNTAYNDYPALVRTMNQLSGVPTAPPNDPSKRYQTIKELPDFAQPTIQKLIDAGHLKGDGAGLDLSYDMARLFVILDRAGKL